MRDVRFKKRRIYGTLMNARMHHLTGNCVPKESHRSKDGCRSQVNTGHIFRTTNSSGNSRFVQADSKLVLFSFRGSRHIVAPANSSSHRKSTLRGVSICSSILRTKAVARRIKIPVKNRPRRTRDGHFGGAESYVRLCRYAYF